MSASELASASGVGRPVLYALLARLVEDGEVLKRSQPSGSTGYSLARQATTAPGS